MASWTTDDTDALARCGHCDNCTRPPETVDRKDVTVEAWQILKIVAAVQRQGGRLTLNRLSDLARGAGGGAFEAGGQGKGKGQGKITLDLDEVAGGKIGFSKDVSVLHGMHYYIFSHDDLSVFPAPRTPKASWWSCFFLVIWKRPILQTPMPLMFMLYQGRRPYDWADSPVKIWRTRKAHG